jgi:hypothetical protein
MFPAVTSIYIRLGLQRQFLPKRNPKKKPHYFLKKNSFFSGFFLCIFLASISSLRANFFTQQYSMLTPLPDIHRSAYLDRLDNDDAQCRRDKMNAAAYVINKFGKRMTQCFVGPGTAAAFAGVELMARYPNSKITTHSAPFAWHAMDLVHEKHLDSIVSVNLVAGNVHMTTGIVSHKDCKITTEWLLHSPYSVNKHSISGNRNTEQFHHVLPYHDHVVILASHYKLTRGEAISVRAMGKIKTDIEKNKRKYYLIIPEKPPATMDDDKLVEAKQVLEYLENTIKMEVHRVPDAKDYSDALKYIGGVYAPPRGKRRGPR